MAAKTFIPKSLFSTLPQRTDRGLRSVVACLCVLALLPQAAAQIPPYDPPDPLEEAHAPNIAFFPDSGQYTDQFGDPTTDVAFASACSPLKLFIRKYYNFLSFVLPILSLDTLGLDTAYRFDQHLRPSDELP